MQCKYLSVVPYKALEKFSKAFYGTTGGTYSARVLRPVMPLTAINIRKAGTEIILFSGTSLRILTAHTNSHIALCMRKHSK